jgi:hypothetical protein
MVSISLAAQLLGISRTTLSRQIEGVKNGNPPQAKDPRVTVVAWIFISHGKGVNPAVEAALLIKALNIPAQQVTQTPPPAPTSKEKRHRISKKERSRLRTRPAGQLRNIFDAAYERVITRNNINARLWLKEIIDAMMMREISFPEDRVEGIPTGRFVPFASLADWAASAGPKDCYFFFFRKGTGRPLDFLMLTADDLECATFRFLNLTEWFGAMQHAMHGEATEAEDRMYKEKLHQLDGKSDEPLPGGGL